MKPKSLILFALVSAALLPAARADIDIDIRLGRASPPPPPEVIVVDPVGPTAPPPWAKPRMFHSTYNYYYYPEANVYYRADNHSWFFMDGRNWRTSRELPNGIRVDFGRSVSLRLDSDRPYTYHDRVVAYYPPSYFTRVRYKDRDNKWHGAPEHGPDRNKHDDRRDDHDRDNRDRDRH